MTEPRPEDSRALELALALDRAGTHPELSSRLRVLVGTENEGRLLAATRVAESVLELQAEQRRAAMAVVEDPPPLEPAAPEAKPEPEPEPEPVEPPAEKALADRLRETAAMMAVAMEQDSPPVDAAGLVAEMREMADAMDGKAVGFDESKHPRKPDGEFARKPGGSRRSAGGGGSIQPMTNETPPSLHPLPSHTAATKPARRLLDQAISALNDEDESKAQRLVLDARATLPKDSTALVYLTSAAQAIDYNDRRTFREYISNARLEMLNDDARYEARHGQ